MDLSKYSNYVKIDLSHKENFDDHYKKLISVFTLAGCSGFDIAAMPLLIKDYKDVIISIFEKSNNIISRSKPFISTNINLKLLDSYSVGNIKSLIDDCNSAGSDCIRIDGMIDDYNKVEEVLELTRNKYKEMQVSIYFNRKNLSNAFIVERIKQAKNILKNNFLIEAGSLNSREINQENNTLNLTLQSLSTVDIINKELKLKEIKYKKLPVIIADVVDLKTINLAKKCGVNFDGIVLKERSIKEFSNFILKRKYDNCEIPNSDVKMAKRFININ